MAMIGINYLNESKVLLDAPRDVLEDLYGHFSFRVPGYQFQPKYKAGKWDGYIRLVHLKVGTAPKGLIPDLVIYLKRQGHEVKVDPTIVTQFKTKITFDPSSIPLRHEPRDFQAKALDLCLTNKRQIILSSTGSGKSMIVYLLCRALEGAKILIMVPRTGLVDQLHNDFRDYSESDEWDVDKQAHKIYSGTEKESDAPIYISTWQSMQRMGKEYLEQFDVVIADEVHEYQAAATSKILDHCTNAFMRFGFTGSIQDSKTNEMQLKALFGPIARVTNTKELQEREILSNLDIKAIVLNYPKVITKDMAKISYQEEVEFLIGSTMRNQFLVNLALSTTGNTLMLFDKVKKHSKVVHQMLCEMGSDKEIWFIDGSTPAKTVTAFREAAERQDNLILVTTYQKFSTGFNIVNLRNVIFGAPTKSKIRVLQSIGRGLRRSEDKTSCKLFDVADDLTGGRKKANTTLDHFLKRHELYVREGFKTKVIEVPLKG